MAKRPFKKIAGVYPETDRYAIEHDRRPFVFAFTTKDGGTVSYSGHVAPTEEAMKVLHEVCNRLQKEAKK